MASELRRIKTTTEPLHHQTQFYLRNPDFRTAHISLDKSYRLRMYLRNSWAYRVPLCAKHFINSRWKD